MKNENEIDTDAAPPGAAASAAAPAFTTIFYIKICPSEICRRNKSPQKQKIIENFEKQKQIEID